MDVDSFIAKYRPDWERLEALVAGGASALARLPGPAIDETVGLYLRVSSHLAEARARYLDPELTRYLSALVARARGAVYGTPGGTLRGLGRTLTVRYREAIRSTAPFIVAAAVLFLTVLVAIHVWIVSSPEAAAGLVPAWARAAIERVGGEPADFGIGSGALSTAILLNNIQVAFFAWALGITAGIGTVWVLWQNALLIGSLSGGFAVAGQSGPFWSLILPHGLLELTAIFLAAGAGLRIGWAVVDPGDRRRAAALREAAAESVVVVGGTIPAFVVAGLIEGYVTASSLPTAVQLGIGAVVWVLYLLAFLRPQRRP